MSPSAFIIKSCHRRGNPFILMQMQLTIGVILYQQHIVFLAQGQNLLPLLKRPQKACRIRKGRCRNEQLGAICSHPPFQRRKVSSLCISLHGN
ncbi:hypothetical protein D1872_281400 [compost metagenome]